MSAFDHSGHCPLHFSVQAKMPVGKRKCVRTKRSRATAPSSSLSWWGSALGQNVNVTSRDSTLTLSELSTRTT